MRRHVEGVVLEAVDSRVVGGGDRIAVAIVVVISNKVLRGEAEVVIGRRTLNLTLLLVVVILLIHGVVVRGGSTRNERIMIERARRIKTLLVVHHHHLGIVVVVVNSNIVNVGVKVLLRKIVVVVHDVVVVVEELGLNRLIRTLLSTFLSGRRNTRKYRGFLSILVLFLLLLLNQSSCLFLEEALLLILLLLLLLLSKRSTSVVGVVEEALAIIQLDLGFSLLDHGRSGEELLLGVGLVRSVVGNFEVGNRQVHGHHFL